MATITRTGPGVGSAQSTEAIAAATLAVTGESTLTGGVTAADLTLNSTNEMNLAIAGVNVLAIDDAAITGHAGAASTDGKSLFAETQDGGAAAADAPGRAGATLRLTAGAGSAGGAHTSNNPAGGNSGSIELVAQAGGAAGAGGSGAAGKAGRVAVAGGTFARAGTVTAKTTAATLTAAELLTGLMTITHAAGANQDYTLPTGTLMSGAIDMATGEFFEWKVWNLSGTPATNTATIVAGTDHTIVGPAVIGDAQAGLNERRMTTLKTGATTWVTYIS